MELPDINRLARAMERARERHYTDPAEAEPMPTPDHDTWPRTPADELRADIRALENSIVGLQLDKNLLRRTLTGVREFIRVGASSPVDRDAIAEIDRVLEATK